MKTACANRAGAAASVERRRREPRQGDLARVTRARQHRSFECMRTLCFQKIVQSAPLVETQPLKRTSTGDPNVSVSMSSDPAAKTCAANTKACNADIPDGAITAFT